MDVDADSHDHRLDTRSDGDRLDEDARQLSTSRPDVVWPLDRQGRRWGDFGDAVAHRETGEQRQKRKSLGIACDAEEHREEQSLACRTDPGAPAPAAPVRLVLREPRGAVRSAALRAVMCLVVRRWRLGQ